MGEQMELTLGSEKRDPIKRRLDRSLERMQTEFDALSEAERIKMAADKGVKMIEILARVRGMEMAEEDVFGRPVKGVADLYDHLIEPGQPLVSSLLKVAVAAVSGRTAGEVSHG